MGIPLRMQKIMKNTVSTGLLDQSKNVFNTLVLKAQTKHGLTEKDKKLLASSIVDWLKEKERAKQENTVYWTRLISKQDKVNKQRKNKKHLLFLINN